MQPTNEQKAKRRALADIAQRLRDVEALYTTTTQGEWSLEQGFLCANGYEHGVSVAEMDTDVAAGETDGQWIAAAHNLWPHLVEIIQQQSAMISRLTSMNPTERSLAFREVLGLPNPNEPQNEAGETAAEPEDYIDALRAEIESLRSQQSAGKDAGLREAAKIAEAHQRNFKQNRTSVAEDYQVEVVAFAQVADAIAKDIRSRIGSAPPPETVDEKENSK